MSYYEESKQKNVNRTDRYRNCLMLKDRISGDVLLSQREIVDIPLNSADMFHKVKLNEVGRLDLIAYNYYKNPLLWWVIAQANNIYDPIAGLEVGTLLRIPAIETLYGFNGVLL